MMFSRAAVQRLARSTSSSTGTCSLLVSQRSILVAPPSFLSALDTTVSMPLTTQALVDSINKASKRSENEKWNHRLEELKKWNHHLEELKKFKSEHGHCKVPKSSVSLYKWLDHQRNQSLNPNHSRCLKDVSEMERRTKYLESVLGIKLQEWRSSYRIAKATAWDARLEELKKFKSEHGHCKVPKSSVSLYKWLDHQRNQFLNPNHSQCLKDVPERERRTKDLESVLGMKLQEWRSSYRIAKATAWDARLEELKKFKSEHGHCKVPASSGSLGLWLMNQRNQSLNPNHSRCIKDVSERERRTKDLESVLGESLV